MKKNLNIVWVFKCICYNSNEIGETSTKQTISAGDIPTIQQQLEKSETICCVKRRFSFSVAPENRGFCPAASACWLTMAFDMQPIAGKRNARFRKRPANNKEGVSGSPLDGAEWKTSIWTISARWLEICPEFPFGCIREKRWFSSIPLRLFPGTP